MYSADILSERFKRSPHAELKRALEHGPLVKARLPLVGEVKFAVTHEAVQDVLKATDAFAVDARNAGHKKAFGLPFMPKSLKMLSHNLLAMDDPEHQRLRRLADAPFRRVEIDKLRVRIETLADQQLDEFEARGGSDIMTVFRDLPIRVISDMLGLTDAARDRLTRDMSAMTGAGSTFALLRAMMKMSSVIKHLRAEIVLARANPRPGLLNDLIQAEADGDKMSEDDLVAMVLVLFVAGHDTTTNLLSTGLHTLMTKPAAWAVAQGLDDDGWRVAVDELMRYCGPVQFTKPRFVKQDMAFHGLRLKKGEKVMAFLAAANFDPIVFDNPMTLDLGRRPNRHTGWGGGPHICLGLHLAKMEALVMLSKIVQRWPDLAVGGDNKWTKRLGVRGLLSFQVQRNDAVRRVA